MKISIVWDLLQINKTFFIFGLSPTLNIPVTTCSKPSIIPTLYMAIYMLVKNVILIVSFSKVLKEFRPSCIADCLENHIISLLKSYEVNIFLCLIKGHNSSKSFFSFVHLVHCEWVFVVYVVATPQIKAKAPG